MARFVEEWTLKAQSKAATPKSMPHSLSFERRNVNGQTEIKHTWTHWHLIPVSTIVIAQPTPVYTYVDIPGADGAMDLSDYLVGRPTYSDRQGTIEFYVADITDNAGKGTASNWNTRRTDIANFLNGSKMKVYLDDDQNHYYEGRVFFKQWTPDASHSKVTIEYRLKPYRYTTNGREDGL